MSALKFLTILPTGLERLVTALTASTGVTDANKVIATTATGKIDLSFFPAGVEVSVENIVTDEALSSGDFINIFSNAGTRTVRKANAAAATPRPAQGFVLSGYAATSTAVVYTIGENDQLSGLTPGTRYFLSGTTGGALTTTPNVTTVGNLLQMVGFATSPTSLRFEFDSPIEIG